MTKSEMKTFAKEIAKELFSLMQEKEDTYLDSDGAAEFLHISKQTLYNKRKEVPRVKLGGKVLYSKLSLTRYAKNSGLIK